MNPHKPSYEELLQQIELERSINRNLQQSNNRLAVALGFAQIGIHEWRIETDEHIWDERVYEFWGLTYGSCWTG